MAGDMEKIRERVLQAEETFAREVARLTEPGYALSFASAASAGRLGGDA